MREPNPDIEPLVAPCGLDCRLCRAHLRERDACPGCRFDGVKSRSCLACQIKNCAQLRTSGDLYCFSCPAFPCAVLNRLDKRYRTRYGMSPVDNLTSLRSLGIEAFLRAQNQRWTCPLCGGMLCVHQARCPACGHAWRA